MIEDSYDVSPEQAARELLRMRNARQSLIGFSEYTMEKYIADRFHQKVARALEKVERGEIRRLMIFAPPQHGKSELSTRRFPAFYMGRNPQKNVISASYSADFARGFGRNVRDIVATEEFKRLYPAIGIRHDNAKAEEWELTTGGKYWAVGIDTATTGRGAHLFLIDDPIKNRTEADSPTYREKMWSWYTDVVYTRLQEDAQIVMTLTRWHHDDLAGRALELMRAGRGQGWEILSLPALPKVRFIEREDGPREPILNDDGTVPNDPLGRMPDEPLAPNRFSAATLFDRQDVLGPRSWSAMYQQEPMAADGGMFVDKWFEHAGALPQNRMQVRAWDFGATLNGDYTVGVKMSKDRDGVFYVEDVIRLRGTPMTVRDTVLRTAKRDGYRCRIIIPQDPGQAGVSQAQQYVRDLAGYRVKTVRPTGRKEVRAEPFAAQCEGRNVKLVPGAWNQTFLDELGMFPLGSNDDQVDAASDAFNNLLGSKRPAVRDF